METRLFTVAAVVLVLVGCSDSQKHSPAGEGSAVFTRKIRCYELGSGALKHQRLETGRAKVSDAEWCYHPKLNTCIYSTVTIHFEKDDVPLSFSTIDLLTNRQLFAVPPNASDSDLEKYDKQREQLFSECQK